MRICRSLCVFVLLMELSIPRVAAGTGEDGRSPTLIPQGIDNLHLVGKVWGFLKYHHPAVTNGCLDWDKELLDRLPRLRDQQTRDDLLVEINAWVGALDKIDILVGCVKPKSEAAVSLSSKWINDSEFVGQDLSQRFGELATAPISNGGQHYVSLRPGVGNPVFQNEPDYVAAEGFDWRYRILALYRFWNIIEYWSPYRDLIDIDFDEVLRDHIPRLYSADETKEYVLALMMLTATAQDAHTSLWSSIKDRPPTGPAIAPFFVRFVEGRPIVWRKLEYNADVGESDSLQCDELEIGDIVISMDGTPVSESIEVWKPYYGFSNASTLVREVARNLLRGEVGPFDLEVDRGGDQMSVCSYRIASEQVDLSTTYSHDLVGETFQFLDEGIAYLKLSTISEAEVAGFSELVRDADSLIIDLRGYPKTFVVFSIGQHLVGENTPFARFTNVDTSRPGSFSWSEPIAMPFKEPTFDGRVVILVDETTQSQAEYTAMAFRASPHAVVIGSQTAGADGNASHIPLPGGHRTMISGIGVYYPDKRPTQKVGIVPDIEVRPTIAGIRSGKDEVLEAALEYIRSDRN